MMDVVRALMDRYRQNEGEALAVKRALRAATYALAVLCGHTHPRSMTESPLALFLKSKQQSACDSSVLVDWLVERLREVKDTGVCANLVLALEHAALFLPPEAGPGGEAAAVAKAVDVILSVLYRDWSVEAGIPVFATVLAALLDQFAKHEALLDYAISHPRYPLDEPLRSVLTLPTAHSRLILLGIEILHMAAERYKYRWVKHFVEPLVALLQRDQADVSERVIKALQLMFNAEPGVLCGMIGYGIVPALYATFLRFKQHDNVLANVYGMVGSIYNVETVLTASRILEALAKKEDPSVQAAFLQAVSIDDVDKIGLLHRTLVGELKRKPHGKYLRITEGYSKNSTTREKVDALNASLRNQLEHIRALCQRHPSASTAALSLHIVENVLPRWRADLSPIIAASLIGGGGDGVRMDDGDDVGPLECENGDGSDITINLLPRGHNWPAQPCRFKSKTSVTWAELHDFIYKHYHVSPVKLFTSSARPALGASGGQELTSDFQLKEYLTFCNMRLNGDNTADLELHMAVNAWGHSGATGVGMVGGVYGVAGGLFGGQVPSDAAVEEELSRVGLELDGAVLSEMKRYFKNPAMVVEGVHELSWDGFKRFLDALFGGWASSTLAATKMLFDIFDEDDNAHLSFMELARCLALMTVPKNDAERTAFLFRRYASGASGLTLDGLTKMLSQTDTTQPEKVCRVLAEHSFQKAGLSPGAQCMSEDQFKRVLNDGLQDALRYFYHTNIYAKGGGGGGRNGDRFAPGGGFNNNRGGMGGRGMGRGMGREGRGGGRMDRGGGRGGGDYDGGRQQQYRDTFGNNNWTNERPFHQQQQQGGGGGRFGGRKHFGGGGRGGGGRFRQGGFQQGRGFGGRGGGRGWGRGGGGGYNDGEIGRAHV